MTLFLSFIFNSLLCGMLVLFLFIIRKVCKGKVSYQVLYYSEIFFMFFFAFPISVLFPESDKAHVQMIMENNRLALSRVTSDGTVIAGEKNINLSFISYMFLIWIIVVILLLCAVIIRHVYMMKSINRWKTVLSFENDRFKRGQIYQCSVISTPVLIGIIKPNVLIPDNTTEEDMQLILKHEGIHRKRKDLLIKIVLSFITILNWFNPLCWLLLKIVNEDCELSCDEISIKEFSKENKVRYARLLLHFAEQQSRVYFLGMSFINKNTIQARIQTVIEGKQKQGFLLVVFLLVFGGMLTGICIFSSRFQERELLSPENIITTYMKDPEGNQELASTSIFRMEWIDSLELTNIEKANANLLVGYQCQYTGDYTEMSVYSVEYNIVYKDDFAYMMSEPSGTKKKFFYLIKTTDYGWQIDSIGY